MVGHFAESSYSLLQERHGEVLEWHHEEQRTPGGETMPTPHDAPYKVAQRVSRRVSPTFHATPPAVDEYKALRRSSGLSGRQWRKRKRRARLAAQRWEVLERGGLAATADR